MNKKSYYHYAKNDFSTITSRGLGSSSGIIKLSNQYSTEKNIYSGIKKENNKNINSSSLSSNSEKDIYNETIKGYNNYLSNNNNNFISTLPYTKENITNNNQNMLFGNKFINNNKDINFDFYKHNPNNEQMKNNETTIKSNKNENGENGNEVVKQPMNKFEIENLLTNEQNMNKTSSKKLLNKSENNPNLITNKTINSIQNSDNHKNFKNIDLSYQQKRNNIFKKSLSSNITNNINTSNNKNNDNSNKTIEINRQNSYVKKLSILNTSISNKKENFYSISNYKKTKNKNSPRSSAINKTVTSALKKSATYNSQEYLISIIENYAREVGISAYNFRTSEYFITQFIDTENYINTLTMINYWRPIEIVMNQKSENSSLYKIIHKTFSNIYIGFLPRNKFNMDYGKEIYIKSNIRELSLIDLNTKYVCMASLSGLFNYLENNPDYYMTDSYNIHFHYLENHLNISFNTTLDLELLMNRKNNKTYGSLFSLFSCKTIGGWRLLRSNILQPFTKESQIIERQEKIEELKENPDLYSFIRDSLFSFREIEIYITKLLQNNDNHNENDDKYFILKNKLEAIKGIKDSLCFIPNFVRFLKSYLHSKLNIMNDENENDINNIINTDTNKINNINNTEQNNNNIENNKYKYLKEIISFFSQKEFEILYDKIDSLISNENELESGQYLEIFSQQNNETENGNIYNDKNINNDISFSNFIANMKNKKKKANFYNYKSSEIFGLLKKNDEILFLVRRGENNTLDMTRKTFIDTLSQVNEEFEVLKGEIGDPHMKLYYNEKKRFYISIDKKYYKSDDFVVTRKRGNKYFCTNMPLESLGARITDLKNDIISMNYKLLDELIQYLKNNISLLYSLSGFVANLDIICAFTEYAINNLYCSRPIINQINKDISYIYGKNCCHPLLNKVFSYKGNNTGNGADNFVQDNIIPNDYFFINQFNLLLLKGPNASGKTTYMKQLALLIILAQIGSYVPCAYFSFNCRKFLYSNFNLNSISKDINNNQEYYSNKTNIKGSFIKQISEIQSIINNKSYNKSLILLDEPFDNSHSQLMIEIIISLMDLFSKNLNNSFIIISSHNDIVNRLSAFYFHSILGTMKVEINSEKNDFDFLYKFKFTPQYSFDIHDNRKEIENYGISLSKIIGLNKDIINYAEEISENYKENNFDDVVKSSVEMNVLKSFLIKLYKNLFEIMGEKKIYTIKEQVMVSIKNLYNFIEKSLQ